MKKFLGMWALLSAVSTGIVAADYTEGDLRKNDYKWIQMGPMHGHNMKGPKSMSDTYFEIELGGRSGFFDFYGYVDLLDAFNDGSSDQHNGGNFYSELNPRFSIDGMTGRDLSIGPFKEWYIAGWTMAGDGGDGETRGLMRHGIGIGTDVEVPWLGTVGSSLMAVYKAEDYGSNVEGKWDGFTWRNTWFKPLYNFDDGGLIVYQGYLYYSFGSDQDDDVNLDGNTVGRTSDELQMYNGIYYHTERFSIGYGVTLYKNMGQFDDEAYGYDSTKNDSTGAGHFFDLKYKL